MFDRRLGLTALFLAGLGTAGCAPDPSGGQPEASESTPAAAEGGSVTFDDASLEPSERGEPGSVAARLRDASLAAQIKMQLVQDAGLRPYDFDVTVEDGRASLAGNVGSADARRQAEQIAGRVKGIREVRNRIEAPGVPAPTQAQLAEEAGGEETEPIADASRPEPAPPREQSAPSENRAQSTAPAPAEPTYHTVRNGESLWVIARQYDLSIDRLKALNDLRSNSLRPGQRLRVN